MIALVLCAALAGAPTAIVGARVEIGDGTVVENGVVVFENGKIVSVAASGTAPTGATVIDGKGKVLTPGLVHVGSQLGIVEIGLEQATVDTHVDGVTPGFQTIDGFNPQSPRIAIDRNQGGITSAVIAPQGPLLAGTGWVIDTSGSTNPRASAKRAAVFGGFGTDARRHAGGARGGVVLKLREIVDDTRFYAKSRAAFDRGDSRDLALPRVHLEAMIPVVEGKLPLAMNVDRASDIRALLAFAAENKLNVIVLSGAEAWQVKDELAKAKVPVVLTPSSGEPYAFEALYARDDNAALLSQAGVSVVISSGGTDNGTTRVRQEAGIAVSYGMPYADAMKSVTSTPARVFGVDKDIGTIAKGLRADLVLWNGDPFETRTSADAVWIAGVKQDAQTRHTDLAQRYKRRNDAARKK